MKRIQWISGMLAVAALLGSSVSFADQNPWSYQKKGFERVDLAGSSFVVGHGATKEVLIPAGPRDLDRLFVNANTNQCAISKITVTAVSDSGSADSKLVEVSSQPGWYFLEYGMEGVRKIAVTHSCGHDVRVSLIKADLGQHPVDCVFSKCETCHQGGDFCEGQKYDLAAEIIRRMPRDGKYYYLLEALDRLAWKTVDYLKLGSDNVKMYISPITETLVKAKSTALVQGDESFKTMLALADVRGQMVLAEDFFQEIANTKASKHIGEAFFAVGSLIDDQSRLPQEYIEAAIQACLKKRDFRQQVRQQMGQQQQQVVPQIPARPRKGVQALNGVLPNPQQDLENNVEQIPAPEQREE